MEDFNKSQYEAHYREYLESNASEGIGGGDSANRVETLKKYLPEGRRVFELGSGGGVDAVRLREAGYDVVASDYVDNFLSVLKERGIVAVRFDGRSDELPSGFDAVYANAVFVHFSPDEFKEFLERAKGRLENEKIVFVTILKGEGSERSARGRGFERDFHYYTAESAGAILNDAGYKTLLCDESDPKWLRVIATANDFE